MFHSVKDSSEPASDRLKRLGAIGETINDNSTTRPRQERGSLDLWTQHRIAC
jgi:hypothetical protein